MLITTKSSFDEDKYRRGGPISGDYRFIGTADIELANENTRLQSRPEPDNYLCFKPGLTFISKSLEVAGTTKFQELETGNLILRRCVDEEPAVRTECKTDILVVDQAVRLFRYHRLHGLTR